MTWDGDEDIRVTIADDHPVVRAGLARIIEMQPGFRVVGQSGDGMAALEQIVSLKPDVAVLDISMPNLSGIDVIERLNDTEETEFVLLTQHTDPSYLDRAKAAGAAGYVRKDSALDELVQAIQAVLNGDFYVSSIQLAASGETAAALPAALSAALAKLTPTERTVLSSLAQNLTSKEIASMMNVSYRTIQNHRANMCNKLNLRGNNRLLQFALEYRDTL